MAQQREYIGERGGLPYWQDHIHALAMSGLSRAEYCRHHKIAASSLGYWQKKLRRPQENQAQLVAVSMPVDDYGTSCDRSFALHLVLPGNLAIAVSDNFSPQTLTRLLATLEGR